MHGARTTACLLASAWILFTASHAPAVADAGPYQAIVERNVFGLKPPPAPPSDTPAPPPPLKITLTGITTILGNKRALMSVAVPNKPPETYMLAEGQRQGEIEVVSIDERAGTVSVKNHGIPQSLDFKTDGAKAQPQPVIPGIIPPPGHLPPPPGAQAIPPPTIPGNPPPTPAPGAQVGGQLPTPPRTLPMPMRSIRIPSPQNPPAGSGNVPPIPQQ